MRAFTAVLLASLLAAAGCGSSKTGWRDADAKGGGGGVTTAEVVLPRSVVVVASGENGFPGLEAVRREAGEEPEANEAWEKKARSGIEEGLDLIKRKRYEMAVLVLQRSVLPSPSSMPENQSKLLLEALVRAMTISSVVIRDKEIHDSLVKLIENYKKPLNWSDKTYQEWSKTIVNDTRNRMGLGSLK